MVPRAGNVEGPREETSLLAFLSIVLSHRRLVALCALAGMAVFGVLAASQASLYLSRASFVVKGSRAPAQIGGGAGAFGINIAAAAEFSQSIVFYSDLVPARTILVAAAKETYLTSDSRGRKRTLAEIYGIEEKNPDVAAVLAAERLAPDVSSNIYSRSGIVGLSVQAVDPLLAQQIAANILVEVNEYSIARRHRQAVDERKFIEGLVGDARARLHQAESAARDFLSVNREYENSPQLRLEHDRLTREVVAQQQVYTALSESLEQAKIEEARDPTELSVVESADLPAEPQRREAARQTLLGLAVGLLVGIVLAFLRQRMLESRNAGTRGFLRFSAVTADAGA